MDDKQQKLREYLMNKYSGDQRQELVDQNAEESSGLNWAAGLAGLGAAMQGGNSVQAGQNIIQQQEQKRQNRLRDFDMGKSQTVADLQLQQGLGELDRASDPNSMESELARETAKKLMPSKDFTGMTAQQLEKSIPSLAKLYQMDNTQLNKLRAENDRAMNMNFKAADLELKQRADQRAQAKEERGIKQEEVKDKNRASTVITAGQTVIRDVNTALETLDSYGRVAGGLGSLTSGIPESPANKLKADIESIKGNVAVDQLLKIKASGAGLGQVPQSQLDMLAGLLGGLRQDMSPDKLKQNLQDIGSIYQDIVEKEGGDPFKMARARGFKESSVGEKRQRVKQRQITPSIVQVQAPNGKIVNVPKEQLQRALDAGGVLIEGDGVAQQ